MSDRGVVAFVRFKVELAEIEMKTGVWQEGLLWYMRCHRMVHHLLVTFIDLRTRYIRTQGEAEKMGYAINLSRVKTHRAKLETQCQDRLRFNESRIKNQAKQKTNVCIK